MTPSTASPERTPRPLSAARSTVARLRAELDSLGGDERARRRQLDLLAHQIREIESVAPSTGEEEDLALEEDRLAGALHYRSAAAEALELLGGESGASDTLARAAAVLGEDGSLPRNGGPCTRPRRGSRRCDSGPEGTR
ncbi:MAG: hypothetical protein M5U19_04950 [Microthrixaceae bacterium]|nr:hypothetical protein [Microthrixaceae bacterium]